MLNELKNILENRFNFSVNKNQLRDITRLIFEITRRQNCSLDKILDHLEKYTKINKVYGRDKFFVLKEELIKYRFPLAYQHEKIDTKKVFLNSIRTPLSEKWPVKKNFTPLQIFVEKEVRNSPLLKNFQKKFPDIPVRKIKSHSEYLKNNKFNLSELKKPLVFITKEKWDFLKPCPCTKHHLRCGYWIFNLGFGCPFDCSYCFLQQYTNFPGLLLPANLEDFFEEFDRFVKKITHPIRIGTGEFCDSLALDEITEYSKKLIPYFREKNVFFELKTKSVQIKNLLEIKASKNIIISWSLNPQELIKTEEKGAATLEDRLKAAALIQEKGYQVGFHFDPIIHASNWENMYKKAVDSLYRHTKAPFAWISLGTLRSNRTLKTIAEIRIPKTNIFYGELFIGEDKKLRYPKFIRKQIYTKMIKWIRHYDTKTPVYLCMEGEDNWQVLGNNLTTTSKIEKYILNK
jgi:spore photoproduct lyase